MGVLSVVKDLWGLWSSRLAFLASGRRFPRIPVEPVFENKVGEPRRTERWLVCASGGCGQIFRARSSSHRYCDECAPWHRRNQHCLYMREWRARRKAA